MAAAGEDKRDERQEPIVTGRIVIAAATPALSGAAARVRLEDVSLADAAAIVVAETVIPDVRHDPAGGETELPFALSPPPGGPPILPRHSYAVRVWVDRDGDGREGPGDLHSTQSYPVLTRGFGRTVTIRLGPR